MYLAIYIDITDFLRQKTGSNEMYCNTDRGTEYPHKAQYTQRLAGSKNFGSKDIKYAESFTMSDSLVVAELPVSKLQTF